MGLVENMAYFTDGHGEVHHPFGTTQLEAVRNYAGVDAASAVRLPIEPVVSEACDEGAPVVTARPDSETSTQLRAAAARLTYDLAHLMRPQSGSGAASQVASQLRFDPQRGLVLRVLQGVDEGREFVVGRQALAQLPGGPLGPGSDGSALSDATAKGGVPYPAKVNLGATVDGDEAAVISWEGGKESRLSYDELKQLAMAAEAGGGLPTEEPRGPAGCSSSHTHVKA